MLATFSSHVLQLFPRQVASRKLIHFIWFGLPKGTLLQQGWQVTYPNQTELSSRDVEAYTPLRTLYFVLCTSLTFMSPVVALLTLPMDDGSDGASK